MKINKEIGCRADVRMALNSLNIDCTTKLAQLRPTMVVGMVLQPKSFFNRNGVVLKQVVLDEFDKLLKNSK